MKGLNIRASSLIALFAMFLAPTADAFAMTSRLSVAGCHPPYVSSAPSSTYLSSTTSSSSSSNPKEDEDKALKRARSATASQSIFLQLFGFSAPSPTSMIFVVLAISLGINGNVAWPELIFSGAYPLYLGFLNRFRFNLNKPAVAAGKEPVPLLREGRGKWYFNYVISYVLLSVIIPSIYCFAGPKYIARAAVPYTYLALCQNICESLCRSPNVHELVRLLVPLGFNVFRFWAVFKWVKVAFTTYDTAVNASLGVHIGHIFGMALSAINAGLLTYNFFGFLLSRVLPQYLDKSDFPDAEVKWVGQLIPVAK